MNKRNLIILLSIIIAVVSIITVVNMNKQNRVQKDEVRIVTSFYPIYIMTLNIAEGIDGVTVTNMAEAHTGCIHDYSLTTADLRKFEHADIFIENGQGIEEFSNKIISSYPHIKVIESSKNINDIISTYDAEINAHFWTSIDNYILQVREIVTNLKEIDIKHSEEYEKNSAKYIKKLEELKSDYEEKTEEMKDKGVISLNESFSYFTKFIGMNEILIETDHEQSILSAEEMKNIIKRVNQEQIKCIIIGEDDNEQNANAIKNETNIKIYKLKDGMSGDNSLDSYINIMKYNLDVLCEMRREL